MLVVRRQSKDLWVPAAEVASPRPDAERCAAGDIYLATDRGERKATGSYYTPQYIVEYIVENTLEPLVEECPTAEDILKLRVLDPAMGSGHFLVEATDFLARKLLEREASSAVAAQGSPARAVGKTEPETLTYCASSAWWWSTASTGWTSPPGRRAGQALAVAGHRRQGQPLSFLTTTCGAATP